MHERTGARRVPFSGTRYHFAKFNQSPKYVPNGTCKPVSMKGLTRNRSAVAFRCFCIHLEKYLHKLSKATEFNRNYEKKKTEMGKFGPYFSEWKLDIYSIWLLDF